MKITDLKMVPTKVGYRHQLIIKIETDEGIYGLGESGLSFRELATEYNLQALVTISLTEISNRRGPAAASVTPLASAS